MNCSPLTAVVHGLGEPMRGPAAFKPFHAAYRDALPDIHLQIEDMVAEGDKVAFRWTATRHPSRQRSRVCRDEQDGAIRRGWA